MFDLSKKKRTTPAEWYVLRICHQMTRLVHGGSLSHVTYSYYQHKRLYTIIISFTDYIHRYVPFSLKFHFQFYCLSKNLYSHMPYYSIGIVR
jgi:hypothetical protein